MRVGLDGGSPPQPISDFGWIEGIETEDGLFAVRVSETGVWRLAPGQTPERLVPDFLVWNTGPHYSSRVWTVANGRIYIVDAEPATRRRVRILSYPISGGAPTTVVDAEGFLSGSIALDPVSGAFVYGLQVDEQSDIGIIRYRRR
jgi:hypothetical protein